MRSFVAIVAFAGKEIRLVLRQPKLMAALVLGPFMILGLFAFGFQPEQPPLRTLLVMEEGSPFAEGLRSFEESVEGTLEIVGTVPDEAEALGLLDDGEVDLVVVAPEDAAERILADERAEVMVYHDRLDPFDRTFINVSAQTAVDELNRLMLAEITAHAQEQTGDLPEVLAGARSALDVLATALEAGDRSGAGSARMQLIESLEQIDGDVEFMLGFAGIMGGALGSGSNTGPSPTEIQRSAEEIELDDPQAAREDMDRLADDLDALEAGLATFSSLSPEVLVQPFVTVTETPSGDPVPLTVYYTPAVVVVLLQHVVLTFAALSIAHERAVGATETFRAGPVRVWELLVGKSLGYAVLGGGVAVLLSLTVVLLLGTPMRGSWVWLAVIAGLTITASLGLGFVISAAAATDVQAVQYSMLALLFTIFFSGLIVSLERLGDGVRQLAYLVPATPGTVALHEVMFRGTAPSAWLVLLMVGYSLAGLTLAAWWLDKRQVA